MIGAELHEVGEFRLSTAGPVLDVVGVEETGLPAAGEAAAVVAVDSARLSAGGTLRVFRPTDSGRPPRSRIETTPASQASLRAVSASSGGRARARRPGSHGAVVLGAGQGPYVDVHDDLVALAAGPFRGRRTRSGCRPSKAARRDWTARPTPRVRLPWISPNGLATGSSHQGRVAPRSRATPPGAVPAEASLRSWSRPAWSAAISSAPSSAGSRPRITSAPSSSCWQLR